MKDFGVRFFWLIFFGGLAGGLWIINHPVILAIILIAFGVKMLNEDLLHRKASRKQNEPYIDNDKSMLWLVTWFQNRQIYVSARSAAEAKQKARTYIATTFKLPEELLNYAASSIIVEVSKIEWPM